MARFKAGSQAAKNYMASIRKKKGKPKRVGTVKKTVAASKTVRKTLKEKGLKLPHGYTTKARSISGIMSEGKSLLAERIGILEARKFTTKLKRDKNKIAKQIRELKTSYRKLT